MSERIDETGFGTLKLVQEAEDFCYGVDAVLLADFAAKQKRKIRCAVDLGTGNGAACLMLGHMTDVRKIAGVEVQKEPFALFERNIEVNALTGKAAGICENVRNVDAVKAFLKEFAGDELSDGHADVVISNPPYTAAGGGMMGINRVKMAARHEVLGTLEDFMRCASELLMDRGDFYMVHRPARLVDICELARKYRLEPKEMQMVSPYEGSVPNILLIHCVKRGGKDLKWLEPLYIYEKNGKYSKKILEIYEK